MFEVKRIKKVWFSVVSIILASAVAGCASAPVTKAEKKVVTIYEFRSSVQEVQPNGATDMFMTALVKTGTFAVAERQRLQQGVMAEKQLNSQGSTTGASSEASLAGVDYIFEGSITEANPNKSKNGLAGTFKGLGIESSKEKGEIGLDVRVIDAKSGMVLDAVNVRKTIQQGGFSATGVGSFVKTMTKTDLKGADLNVTREYKQGVDKAMRDCIEEAVNELTERYGR